MKVEDIIKSKGNDVHKIHAEAIVSDALRMLNEKRIGALIVIDNLQKIQGIVTERDIMRYCYQCHANIKGVAIQDVMTPREKLIVCDLADDIDRIMETMTEKRIRHLPVVDEKGMLLGIISVGDVIKILLTHKDYEIKYLKDYIENKYPV
ncbi:MAG TPA: CBS domain-containing protein [Patescibacteria group bacterium]|nr:CBS domain-containing protein [Patescibacteria group bacterium]